MPEILKVDFYETEKKYINDISKIDSWCKSKANKESIDKLMN